jgi:hypothetical protein
MAKVSIVYNIAERCVNSRIEDVQNPGSVFRRVFRPAICATPARTPDQPRLTGGAFSLALGPRDERFRIKRPNSLRACRCEGNAFPSWRSGHHGGAVSRSAVDDQPKVRDEDVSITSDVFHTARGGNFRGEERNAVENDTLRVVRSCRRHGPGDGGLHRRCRSGYSDRAGRSFLPEWK